MKKKDQKFLFHLFVYLSLIFMLFPSCAQLLNSDDGDGFFQNENYFGYSLYPDEAIQLQENSSSVSVRRSLSLKSQPSDDVEINIASLDTSRFTVNPEKLIFTKDNWSEEQTVTIQAVDNDIADGDIPTALTFSSSSGDKNFDNESKNLTVYIDDDEVNDVSFNPGGAITVSEDVSDQYVFDVALAGKPRATVSLTLYPEDGFSSYVEFSLDGSTFNRYSSSNPINLQFDSSNWNIPVSIYVRSSGDDSEANGNREFFLITDPLVSEHASFQDLDPYDLEVRVLDEEYPEIYFTSTLVYTSEDGVTGTTQICIQSKPQDGTEVNINFISVDTGEVEIANVDPLLGITFDDSNWTTCQDIIFRGVDDSIFDGPVYSIVVPFINGDLTTDTVYQEYEYSGPVLNVLNYDNEKAVFITANTFQGNLGGASGADTLCNNVANKPTVTAGSVCDTVLQNSSFKAMVGQSGVREASPVPTDWVLRANTRYFDCESGNEIFPTLTDQLIDFANMNGGALTISGLNTVWTGFDAGWGIGLNCLDWSDSGTGENANYGDASYIDTNFIHINDMSCDNSLPLYCVEQ